MGFKLGAIAVGCAALLACSAPPAPPEVSGPRDVLVVAVGADLGQANPVTAIAGADFEVIGQVYVPALTSRFDCRLSFQPGVFASWRRSADGREIVHTLTPGLTWSDGRPVTAHDVVATYALARDPAVASPRLGFTRRMEPDWPQALDDLHVAFRFTTAYDPLAQLAHTALTPIPAHVFASVPREALRGAEASRLPVGNGPFRLARHEVGSRFVLEPNPAFTGPEADRPRLARVVFEVIPDAATRLLKLEAGEVDLVEQVPFDALARLAAHPELRLASRGYRYGEHIAWNHTNPRFADPSVRRALSLALDVEGLMRRFFTDGAGVVHAQRSVGPFTPELCDLREGAPTPLPHDPEAAKALLDAAGWIDHDGDGWRDRNGERFAFTLLTAAGNPRRAEVQVWVQAAYKALGIDVTLETREPNAVFDALRRRTFDAALTGIGAQLYIDPSMAWHSDEPTRRAEQNVASYSNPEVDRLIEAGLVAEDPAEAARIWREVQARLYADQPFSFLWWHEDLVAVHTRFEHTAIGVLTALDGLARWEVPPDRVKHGSPR